MADLDVRSTRTLGVKRLSERRPLHPVYNRRSIASPESVSVQDPAEYTESQRRVLVVGATSSSGQAVVAEFHRQGWIVMATYRGDREPEAGGMARWQHLDVADETSIARFVGELTLRGDRFDCLVFVAGVLPGKSLSDYSASEMDHVMQTNFTGQAKCLQVLLPSLNDGSTVIMFSSVSGERGSYDPIYAASKGAIIAFVKSLAVRLAPRVRCIAIAPGLIDRTAMAGAMDPALRSGHLAATPLNQLISTEDVARIVVDLTGPQWAYANGSCIRLNGGAYV